MNGIKVYHYTLSYDYCSIIVYRLFTTIFHKSFNIYYTISYYAGITLNAFNDPLCSKCAGIIMEVPSIGDLVYHNGSSFK